MIVGFVWFMFFYFNNYAYLLLHGFMFLIMDVPFISLWTKAMYIFYFEFFLGLDDDDEVEYGNNK